MLGDSSLGGGGDGGGNSTDAVAVAAAAVVSAAAAAEGAELVSVAAEEGERSFGGGNRWPRQETLALLKIRSDMDVVFRDASVKGPLWEDVSRKLAELGYHRSAKKCKEKFENVYKYHKRTKEGRTGKSEGKTYRFFDQLQAIDYHHHHHQQLQLQSSSSPAAAAAALAAIPATPVSVVSTTTPANTTTVSSTITIPPPTSTNNNIIPPIITNTNNCNFLLQNPTTTTTAPPVIPPSFPSIPTDLLSNSTFSSSSTSSDETIERRQRRKRKWKDFFGRLTKEVIEKQEQMQKRFLDAIEKREHERMVREEAWRMQEMARINREREILAQERTIAANKDAAVMAFLQKIAEQQNLGPLLSNNAVIPPPQPKPTPPPPPPPQPQPQQTMAVAAVPVVGIENNGESNLVVAVAAGGPSSSRWPKTEVQALIKLRTSMDEKYQDNSPKGPLWEEISGEMRKLGYNRNAKRCKEKWENINKYFKKVKESNKKRPEDSKTCPYFHMLDALYREKNNNKEYNNSNSMSNNNNNNDNNNSNDNIPSSLASAATVIHNTNNYNHSLNPESNATTPALMVRPEQQWPPSGNGRNAEEEEEEEEDVDAMGEEEEEDEEEEEEEGGGNYEIVASKPANSVSAAE